MNRQDTGAKGHHNFIRNIIADDMQTRKSNGQVITRFPPEPNGYLHIGHAKSICLNFGMAQEFGGKCNLRFDDTNPEKENPEFIASIKQDVHWLGYQWSALCFASDYFEELYTFATRLIQLGNAYVDSQSTDEIRIHRGTLTEPGKNSAYRDRSIEENLDLFQRMRNGEFRDGTHVLRAKIDMASPNINLRDPIIYRIRHITHHQTGNQWCIYPMYDFTHCLSDALEGITHSLCTLEFEDHRPLYDWILYSLQTHCHPQQIEFARLSLEYTVMSKRKLQKLVEENYVLGWDDPRMPTLSGLRRRGYTPAAIQDFCERIGITKKDSFIEMGVLENTLREDLDKKARRVMGILRPLKLVILNYPADKVESLSAQNHPQNPEMGSRTLPFSRTLYVEHDDFMENPSKNFFRLAPGQEVRLRYAYIIKCENVIKDPNGRIVELHCSYDPNTLGKNPEDRKIKGVIHWVSAGHAVNAEVRLYSRLFDIPNPGGSDNFLDHLSEDSLQILLNCKLESSLQSASLENRFQFERQGYFCLDTDSTQQGLIFNRTVTLRDSWSKQSG